LLLLLSPTLTSESELENALKRHSSSASIGGAFNGKGQTLGGTPAPSDLKRQVTDTVNGATTTVSKFDPQFKVLLGLIGVYLIFWYLR
jgi:thioredoxin 1